MNCTLGGVNYHSVSYIQRISANPILSEFYLTQLSNRTSVFKVEYNNATYRFNPRISSTANSFACGGTAYRTESTTPFQTITSSIGASANKLAFAGFYARAGGSPMFPQMQYLKIRAKATLTPNTDIIVREYFIWSVAIDPSDTVFYLTTNGDLYKIASSATSISTAVFLGSFFVKFADLEVLSATQLLMKTIDSMAVYDIPTNSIKINIDRKFTSSRLIPGTDKLFVVTHNHNLQLYDISTETPIKDTSFVTLSDSIREVVVNTAAGLPRFYVLTANEVRTYSLTTWTLVATKTKAQLATDIGGGTTVISIDDIAVMKVNSGSLLVLAWTVSGATYDACISMLNEQTLAVQRNALFNSNAQFSLISTSDTFEAGTDFIFAIKPNSALVFTYKAGDPNIAIRGNLNSQRLGNDTIDIILRQMIYIDFPNTGKQTVNYNT